MSIAKEINKELNSLFDNLRDNGMMAIALCENEDSRMKMLAMLQHATRKEAIIRSLVTELDSKFILNDSDPIDLKVLEGTQEAVNIKL